MLKIADDLTDFLEGGLSILLGSVDAQGRPECTRATGVEVERGGARVTLFVPTATSARTLANLQHDPRTAITFSRPYDYRTLQLKGRAVAIHEPNAEQAIVQERWHAGFVEQLAIVGIARALSRRIRLRPSMAITVAVDEIFEQTPGPGAGRRMS